MVTLITVAVGGAWALFLWVGQRKKDRKLARDRIAAQYVNPFLFAAEDLQSRLYNILCRGGLVALRRQYPDGRHSVELLYLVARYFSYDELLVRYSPYGTDKRTIELVQRVRRHFSTDQIQDDNWRIFRPQQEALGKFVLSTRQGEFGTDPDSISLWDFERRFKSQAIDDDRLEAALTMMRDVKDAAALDPHTYERFAAVQRELVELLNYLEGSESHERGQDFSLFPGKRQNAPRTRPPSGHCEDAS